ncbi:hypothetical protein QR98_0079600 [Sarcoptes scabiei]|nr:hypothetical protein QR98_0079600 [Sarcoptes scabiei]
MQTIDLMRSLSDLAERKALPLMKANKIDLKSLIENKIDGLRYLNRFVSDSEEKIWLDKLTMSSWGKSAINSLTFEAKRFETAIKGLMKIDQMRPSSYKPLEYFDLQKNCNWCESHCGIE